MYVETARCDLKLPGCLFPSPPSSPLISFPPPPDFLLPSRRLTFWNVLKVPARFTSKLRVFLHRITKKIVPSAAGGWGGGGGGGEGGSKFGESGRCGDESEMATSSEIKRSASF